MNQDKDYSSGKHKSVQPELGEWLNSFSAHLQIKPHNNRIDYPESFAKGFAKVYDVEPGLTYRIADYQLYTNYVSTRSPSDKFFLIIYFYQYTNCGKLLVSINDEVIINNDEPNYSTLLMTNSLASHHIEVSSGACVKGLTIQLSEDWLKEKIKHAATAKYILFKQKNFFQRFFNCQNTKVAERDF